MEFAAADLHTVKYLRLDPTIRDLTCRNLEILPVVVRLGVTRLKKTKLVYLLDLFGRRGKKKEGWCGLVCG